MESTGPSFVRSIQWVFIIAFGTCIGVLVAHAICFLIVGSLVMAALANFQEMMGPGMDMSGMGEMEEGEGEEFDFGMVAGLEGLIEARKVGNETAAIGALRTIVTVQAMFREGDREGDRMLDYATSISELEEAGLIDDVLGSGVKSGYAFSLSGGTYEWRCAATPVTSSTGDRNFIVCTDGVVRFASDAEADCSSAAIE